MILRWFKNLLHSFSTEVSSAPPENTTSLAAASSARDEEEEEEEEEEILIPNWFFTVKQEDAADADPFVGNKSNHLNASSTKGKQQKSEPNPEPEALVEKVKVNKTPVGGIIWISHYCSNHRILLVGEGDFSFSACLAMAFQSAPRMIATSLNSKEFLRENYENAASNIHELRKRKAVVMYKIDATTMRKHPNLGRMKFDRIIFNFPHAGFHGHRMKREKELDLHRSLVGEFLKNAKEMVSKEGGEVHVTHKTNSEWKVECMASSCHGLRLIEAVKFKRNNYPGYNPKHGFGGDKHFDCHPSKTYKFGLKK